MPPKSNTESIQELITTTGEIRIEVAGIKSVVTAADLNHMVQRIAALETQVGELTKSRDEASRRGSQVVLLAVGALFTVVVQLLIKFLAK